MPASFLDILEISRQRHNIALSPRPLLAVDSLGQAEEESQGPVASNSSIMEEVWSPVGPALEPFWSRLIPRTALVQWMSQTTLFDGSPHVNVCDAFRRKLVLWGCPTNSPRKATFVTAVGMVR